MKPGNSLLTYKPFQNLNVLLEGKSIFIPVNHGFDDPGCNLEEISDEEELFRKAMKGVTPLSRDEEPETFCPMKPTGMNQAEGAGPREDAEILSKLADLVQYGTGFNISETSEYIEGTGYNVHHEFARRLHRGDFSIQAHVDLHGLSARYAQKAFEKFLKWSILTGKRGVLLIHGRGLSSASGPVLKQKVFEWLTRGPWRKWVIAFSSARLCDGGAGATYVLLREGPVPRRKNSAQRNLKWIVSPSFT